jgi:hypothetical protein
MNKVMNGVGIIHRDLIISEELFAKYLKNNSGFRSTKNIKIPITLRTYWFSLI